MNWKTVGIVSVLAFLLGITGTVAFFRYRPVPAQEQPVITQSEPQTNFVEAEKDFDNQIAQQELERKCQIEAYEEFQRTHLSGYGYQAHWNTKLGACFLEMTGWDTELAGTWNGMLWDVGGTKSYGTLTIHNELVASGRQSKNENPALNGTITTCVLVEGSKCSSIEEYYSHRNRVMSE